MKLRFDHPQFGKLVDLAEARLTPEESPSVLDHLAACQRCAAELARLDKVISLMRADRAEEVPRHVTARLAGLFRTHPRTVSSEPSLGRRLLAVLSFDSLQTSTAYGLRSGQANARQLLYVVGEYDIDVRVAHAGEAWLLSGQVFGPSCEGGRIEIEGDGKAERTDLSDQCEFTLPPVPPGSYQLRLRLAEAEIEVPELMLGA